MALICPKCQSPRIDIKNYGQKTFSLIGTVAGAVSFAAGVVRGAEIGAAAGLMIGPIGPIAGGIAGAIIGALIGGTAGGATGAKLGAFVDTHILNQYHCLACKYRFSKKHTLSDEDDFPRRNNVFHLHPQHSQHEPHGDHDLDQHPDSEPDLT